MCKNLTVKRQYYDPVFKGILKYAGEFAISIFRCYL